MMSIKNSAKSWQKQQQHSSTTTNSTQYQCSIVSLAFIDWIWIRQRGSAKGQIPAVQQHIFSSTKQSNNEVISGPPITDSSHRGH
mmetsp:Transcript_20383/g.44272  ORF Transcript_20383/g.44272 Transcript_20383/m.44272 type:complete len:85 (-) Transcript_20383:386-640(-)